MADVSITYISSTYVLHDALLYVDESLDVLVNPLTFTAAIGTTTIGKSQIRASTNNPDGYVMTIKFASLNLTCSSNSSWRISPISTVGGLSTNTWGWFFSTNNSLSISSLSNSWKPPSTSTQQLASDNNAVSNKQYTLYVGTNIDTTKKPCTYNNSLQVTIISNY